MHIAVAVSAGHGYRLESDNAKNTRKEGALATYRLSLMLEAFVILSIVV